MQAADFPAAWKQILETRVPLYMRLPDADRAELHGLINIFLDEKVFEGCDGLAMTDEIKVCVAAQACVLLLHRETDIYPGLRSILVYPRQFYVAATHRIGSETVVEREEPRLGEAWRQGAIVLAWNAVCREDFNAQDGSNLVLHEFAHFLDYEDGSPNGAPLLRKDGSRQKGKPRRASWAQTFGSEFEKLRAAAQNDEETFLNAYGATNPAEFFAVATEAFFEQPHELQAHCPEVYRELGAFYVQDPVQWTRKLPDTSNAGMFFKRGCRKHRRGDLTGALADYSEAIRIKPDYAPAYFHRGEIKDSQNDMAGALSDYSKAIDLNPKATFPYAHRAALRRKMSDVSGALNDLSCAIELDSHFSAAYYQRGRTKEEIGDWEAALADFDRVVELNPDDAALRTRRGRLFYNLRRFPDSLIDFRRAGDLGPPLNYAQFRVWLLRSRLGERDAATRELRKILQSVPDEERDTWNAQIASFLIGELAEGDLLKNAASPDEQQKHREAEAWFYAGSKRLLDGDKNTATEYFEKAVVADTWTPKACSSAAAELGL